MAVGDGSEGGELRRGRAAGLSLEARAADRPGSRSARLTPNELAVFLDRTLARLGEEDPRQRLAIARAFREELEQLLNVRGGVAGGRASARPALAQPREDPHVEALRRRIEVLQDLLERGVAAADATIAAYEREVLRLRSRLIALETRRGLRRGA